ncbi:hypothetical protein DBR32_08135 [Taibaiella sp. KBW10]|uniref:hypothetical protein n=1 Tax=Taibaiella sp. KBW10 TaxID=2153357 RepID=UPI000F9628BC|nr:hypothetical protein [Taibaiella sp. KBW10]RQO30691.1 hypothetical protein DBR32_08135 [Taibaiella sp. KBW10]
MKKGIFIGVLVLLLGSCTKASEEKRYTAKEVKQALDSAKATKVSAMKKEAEKDLAIRSAIELKPLMDSLERQQKKK